MNILALFDDGSRSYYEALKHTHTVISVGIREHKDNYIKLDLSNGKQTYRELKKLVDKYEIDLILASPPCDSFSITSICRDSNGELGTAFHKFSNWGMWSIDEWRTITYPNIARNIGNWDSDKILTKYNQYKVKGELGRKIVDTLMYSLPLLGVPFLVENPQKSSMWRYMRDKDFNYISNNCCYNDYDVNFIQKPTVFYGTHELNLRCTYTKTSKKFRHTQQSKKGENDGGSRSDIPKELVIDIVNQMEVLIR